MAEVISLRPRSYRSAEAAQALILSIAEEHFRDQGIASTTIREIALACGMSSANLHRLYPTKAHLVRAIAERWVGDMRAIAQAAVEQTGASASRRLQDMAVQLATYVRASYIQRRRLHDLVVTVMAEHADLVREHVGNMERAVAEILADGVRRGELKVEPLEDTAQLVFGALARYTHPLLVGEWADEPLEAQAAQTMRLVVGGLTAGLTLRKPPRPS